MNRSYSWLEREVAEDERREEREWLDSIHYYAGPFFTLEIDPATAGLICMYEKQAKHEASAWWRRLLCALVDYRGTPSGRSLAEFYRMLDEEQLRRWMGGESTIDPAWTAALARACLPFPAARD